MTKAVFLDRDGVINRMVYHREHGILDSPFTLSQFALLPRAAPSVRTLNSLGLKAIVVTNQPGIAKRHFDLQTLKAMEEKLLDALSRNHSRLDAIYYCLHHPQAVDRTYRRNCGCRKPEPGLLLQAAKDFGLTLGECYMIGDGITDIQAGSAVGCTTFLIGNHKCDLCRLLSDEDVKPDYIVPNLYQATRIIQKLEGGQDGVVHRHRQPGGDPGGSKLGSHKRSHHQPQDHLQRRKRGRLEGKDSADNQNR